MTYDSVKKSCLLTFMEDTDPSAKFWLLGDPFLRAYYAVHDMDNRQIGFAGKYIDLGPQEDMSPRSSNTG